MKPGLMESLCSVNKAQEGYLVHRFCEMVALICADPLITDNAIRQAVCDKHFPALADMVRNPVKYGATVDFDAADTEDGQQRSLLKIAEGHGASSPLAKGIRKLVLFHGCFSIIRGPSAHMSATCVVVFGDHYAVLAGSGRRLSSSAHFSMLAATASRPIVTPVAMKFMKEKSQFERELTMREQFKLEPEFVIQPHECEGKVLKYDSLNDPEYRAELTRYKFPQALQMGASYPFLVVFPRATLGLQDLITHDLITGQPSRISDIRVIMRQIGEALLHLHEKGIIHGDLKPLNVMKTIEDLVERWKLIDFDAAAGIDEPAGEKYSTGYAPPELMITDTATSEIRVRDASDPREQLIAHPSFDLWSYGVLLYKFVTGEPLFTMNDEDNLVEDEMERLANWDSHKLNKALGHRHCTPQAKDLLEKLLHRDPQGRPASMTEVLRHTFFTDNVEQVKRLLETQVG